MAASEVKGSRWKIGGDAIWHYGVMRYASVDADPAAAAPTIGTTFYTPKGGSAESGATGRVCTKVDYDWETLCGAVCIITAYFRGLRAYA